MVDWTAAHGAIRAIAGKWTLLVFSELTDGPRSYNALLRETGLDTKTLNRNLRSLEESGLIERRLQSERPLRVSYSLTSSAKSLEVLLSELAQWQNQPGEAQRERDTQVEDGARR